MTTERDHDASDPLDDARASDTDRLAGHARPGAVIARGSISTDRESERATRSCGNARASSVEPSEREPSPTEPPSSVETEPRASAPSRERRAHSEPSAIETETDRPTEPRPPRRVGAKPPGDPLRAETETAEPEPLDRRAAEPAEGGLPPAAPPPSTDEGAGRAIGLATPLADRRTFQISPPPVDLPALRAAIDSLDSAIAGLLVARLAASRRAQESKFRARLPLEDPERERRIVAFYSRAAPGAELVARAILDYCKGPGQLT